MNSGLILAPHLKLRGRSSNHTAEERSCPALSLARSEGPYAPYTLIVEIIIGGT